MNDLETQVAQLRKLVLAHEAAISTQRAQIEKLAQLLKEAYSNDDLSHHWFREEIHLIITMENPTDDP